MIKQRQKQKQLTRKIVNLDLITLLLILSHLFSHQCLVLKYHHLLHPHMQERPAVFQCKTQIYNSIYTGCPKKTHFQNAA